MKKSKKKRLRDKADNLWFKKYLKTSCEVCGQSDNVLQGHHFYFKGSYGHLRYNKENHITLCRGCHFVLHHQDPKKVEEKIKEARGKSWYNKLKKQAQKPPINYQTTIGYYETAIKELTKL